MLSTVALLGSLLNRTSGTTSKTHYLKYFLALFSYIVFRNRNRNKCINQMRAPGEHIQITIMIDTQQQYK